MTMHPSILNNVRNWLEILWQINSWKWNWDQCIKLKLFFISDCKYHSKYIIFHHLLIQFSISSYNRHNFFLFNYAMPFLSRGNSYFLSHLIIEMPTVLAFSWMFILSDLGRNGTDFVSGILHLWVSIVKHLLSECQQYWTYVILAWSSIC